ncbi:hypothetical protein AVEN_17647-1, partial [Araneus ventricosus]
PYVMDTGFATLIIETRAKLVLVAKGGCSGLVVRPRVRGQRAPGSKPDSSADPSCMWACCSLNHT